MSTTACCLVSKIFLNVLFVTKFKEVNCDLRKWQV